MYEASNSFSEKSVEQAQMSLDYIRTLSTAGFNESDFGVDSAGEAMLSTIKRGNEYSATEWPEA